MRSARRIAVIGAGAAGLVTARQLLRAGLEPVVFEADAEIGGTWIYTEEVESDPLSQDPKRTRVHTSMYADLRTNLPRDLMAFREFPFDGRGGGTDDGLRFPSHDDVLRYLQRYAETFDLLKHIRFETTVEAVQPLSADGEAWTDSGDEPHGWHVRSRRTGHDASTEPFDAIAVCNGHYAFPKVPSLAGRDAFTGTLLHSHNYRHPETYAGQRVALLGARASGVDLAIEIGEHARDVHLCARGVENAQTFFGRENVFLQPPIEGLAAPATALLSGGSRIDDVDTLLFCTGYDYRLPFFETAGGSKVVEIDDNWVHPLWLDVIAARAGTLGLIGLPNRIVPFPQYELQARLFAAAMAGEIAIPSRAERERSVASRVEELRGQGVAQRHFLQQGDYQFSYNHRLAEICGVPPLPPAFEQVYQEVEQARFRDPQTYRDESYAWVDPESERRFRTPARA